MFWLGLFLIHKYPECAFRAAAVFDFYPPIVFGTELFLFLTAGDHTCFLSASNIGTLWSKTVKPIEPGKGRIPATRSGHTAWWSHPPWSDALAVAWSLPLSPRPPWNHNTRGKTETHVKNYSSATESERLISVPSCWSLITSYGGTEVEASSKSACWLVISTKVGPESWMCYNPISKNVGALCKMYRKTQRSHLQTISSLYLTENILKIRDQILKQTFCSVLES